ncbi:hypothetical protein BASA62_002998 [Batrachochytrium salamandrivorans]|nr:hypothetical protein BASA62_002998 [Batrachochytrium salamandrivorans]
MKLISFAVVSLLAITVIAQSPHGTTTQSLQQSQSTSTPTPQSFQSTSTKTPQQSAQDKVQAKLEELTKDYEGEEMFFRQVYKDAQAEQQKVMELESMVDEIRIELKRITLSSDEESELKQMYYDAMRRLAKLVSKYKKYYWFYTEARGTRDNAKAELQLLRENQELLNEYNSKHGAQVGPSPNSLYNVGVLKKQNDDILREIEVLLVKYNRIKSDEEMYDARLFSAQSGELRDDIRVLQIQSGIAKKILENYKSTRSIGDWIKDAAGLYMWNANI